MSLRDDLAPIIERALAQARREQKEKDAIKLENLASAILSGTVGKTLEHPILIAHLLREVAAAIRAQEN